MPASARDVTSTLAAASNDLVVLEGSVDLEDHVPGTPRRANVHHDWSAEHKWRPRHLTLLADGTLILSLRSRSEIASGGAAAAVDAQFGVLGHGQRAARLPLQGALCVRCPAGVAYGRRPHAFCLQSVSGRKFYFAVGLLEDADRWVGCITDAVAAVEGTFGAHSVRDEAARERLQPHAAHVASAAAAAHKLPLHLRQKVDTLVKKSAAAERQTK